MMARREHHTWRSEAYGQGITSIEVRIEEDVKAGDDEGRATTTHSALPRGVYANPTPVDVDTIDRVEEAVR
jgi:hypothetical protein